MTNYNSNDVRFLANTVATNREFSGDQLTMADFDTLSINWKEYSALCDKCAHAIYMAAHNMSRPGYRIEDVSYELGRLFGLDAVSVYGTGIIVRLSAALTKRYISRSDRLKAARKTRSDARHELSVYTDILESGGKLSPTQQEKYFAAMDAVNMADNAVKELEAIPGEQTVEHKVLWDKNFHVTKQGRKSIEDFMADTIAMAAEKSPEQRERDRVELREYNKVLKKTENRLTAARTAKK